MNKLVVYNIERRFSEGGLCMNESENLTLEDRLAMVDTLEVFGAYPRNIYENYSDARLVEEYDRIVGTV